MVGHFSRFISPGSTVVEHALTNPPPTTIEAPSVPAPANAAAWRSSDPKHDFLIRSDEERGTQEAGDASKNPVALSAVTVALPSGAGWVAVVLNTLDVAATVHMEFTDVPELQDRAAKLELPANAIATVLIPPP